MDPTIIAAAIGATATIIVTKPWTWFSKMNSESKKNNNYKYLLTKWNIKWLRNDYELVKEDGMPYLIFNKISDGAISGEGFDGSSYKMEGTISESGLELIASSEGENGKGIIKLIFTGDKEVMKGT